MHKREKTPSWSEFNILLGTVNLHDNIAHLFVVDIEFDYRNAIHKQMMHIEIFLPIINKQKKLDATERFVFQLFGKYLENDENKPNLTNVQKKRIQH